MELTVRTLQSPPVRELYLTARPGTSGSCAQEGREIFAAIRDVLTENDAWLCQERVFAPRADVAALSEIRRREYGPLADGVEPAFLAAQDGPGVMPGVQVYAIAGLDKPRIVSAGDSRARIFGSGDLQWLTASGLSAAQAGDGSAQVREIFHKTKRLLAEAGGTMHSVARTWVFMDDILRWYDDFNRVRTEFFKQERLLGPGVQSRLPASTGIGVSPANGARCAIDVLAAIGPGARVACHEAAGKQQSANEYGSAFARAAVLATPAGRSILVSGTAAIDAAGKTCFRDNPSAQIQMTIENITAVIQQLSARACDVVQAMAYCAGPEVREEFLARWKALVPWPCLVMLGDVCRDDLLFEVEVTACPGAA